VWVDSQCVADATTTVGITALPSTERYPRSHIQCHRDCTKEEEEEAPLTVWREDDVVDCAAAARLVSTRAAVAARRAATTPAMAGHTAVILWQAERPELDAIGCGAKAPAAAHP
jgi:hypothetical protein